MKNYRFGLLSLLVLSLYLLSSSVLAQVSRIAFIQEGQLTTINADGSDVRVLTEGLQRFQFPAWSPDGESIAVVGSDPESGFIQVFKDALEADVLELYRSRVESPFYLYWSPDSQTLSFLANNLSGGIALHMASEATEDQILALGSPFYWQWTSDSQNILLHSGFNTQRARLGFSNRIRDTLNENLAPAGRFQAPGISASGRYIAYATEDLTGTKIMLTNNPQSNTETLIRELPHQGLAAFSWSPTKDELAVMSPDRNVATYYGTIKLLDAESGLLEPLSDQAAFAFFWSPDGRYIAYFAPAQGGGEIANNAVIQKASLQQVQLQALSLNLIDVEAQTDVLLTEFVASPLFLNQFLPFFDQYALSHSIWSPDSNALVVPTVLDNQIRVTVVEIDGTVTPIALGDSPFWNRR